jgi:hypothetical protein
MTLREFELYVEGYSDNWDRIRELMAWVQTNLINIHVPRGKRKVRTSDLLPKTNRKKKRNDKSADDIPASNLEEAKERARRRIQEEESKAFYSTESGRMLRERIHGEEPSGEDAAEE